MSCVGCGRPVLPALFCLRCGAAIEDRGAYTGEDEPVVTPVRGLLPSPREELPSLPPLPWCDALSFEPAARVELPLDLRS